MPTPKAIFTARTFIGNRRLVQKAKVTNITGKNPAHMPSLQFYLPFIAAFATRPCPLSTYSPTTLSAVQEKINYGWFNCHVLAVCSFLSFVVPRTSSLLHSFNSQTSAPHAKVAHSVVPQCHHTIHSPKRPFLPSHLLFVKRKNTKSPSPIKIGMFRFIHPIPIAPLP